MVGADVEGHIGRGLEGVEQGADLAGTASAELHDHPRAEGSGDLGSRMLQQPNFRAREAVFGLLADLIKQA